MKTKIKLLLPAILFCAFSYTHAQNRKTTQTQRPATSTNEQSSKGPTLEQTLKFIQLNNTNFWELDDEHQVVVQELSVKDRILYCTYRGEKTNALMYIAMRLDQVDQIEKRKNGITIKSTKEFAEFYKSWDNTKNMRSDRVYITVYGSETIEKVYKAFKHLLELQNIKFEDNLF